MIWYERLTVGNISALVLLDLSAAFDTVDHSIMLQVLRDRFCVEGRALEWFESYLCDRTQTYQVKDQQSRPRKVDCGCPTGIGAGSTKIHRLHRRFGRTHWRILSEPSHVRRRHSDDWTDDSSWHSRHHNETSKLHRSNSGMVQIATTSIESSKNRTDLVRVEGQSKEDGRSWLELVHRSWCYKAGQCRSWPWGLSRQWTVHASSISTLSSEVVFFIFGV